MRFASGTMRSLIFLCCASVGSFVMAQEEYISPSDKGDFQYSNPSPYPQVDLDLARIEQQVATSAATRCGTALAAAPLDLGDADSLLGKMMGKAANAVVGKLIGGLLGSSGGGKSKKPKMAKDPIKNKYKQKISHPSGDARIKVGGQTYQDGLLLSARVDKAAGKGTFHTMFLEQPDCSRIWPEQYVQYGLWGSWSLSVSVTKTTSKYQNGKLMDRTVDKSGWSKSGQFDASRGFTLWDQLPGEDLRMILDADEAYLTQLRREIDRPAWQQMGYGKPTDGIRAAGGIFRVSPNELSPDTIAVVHITHIDKGRYKTVGFPMKFSIAQEGRMAFELLPENLGSE